MKKYITIAAAVLVLLGVASSCSAAESVVITLGKITRVVSQRSEILEGTSIHVTVQELEVRILEGPFEGLVVNVENDYTPLERGDRINLALTTDEQGNPVINGIGFAGVYRIPALAVLALIFVVLVLIFGGLPGVRGIASLAGSLALILFALLPGLLHGLSPVGLSIGVSAVIVVLGSFITHGFNRTTAAAVAGMIVTVVIVGVFAAYAVHATRLSGMESEETLYLSSGDFGGNIDLVGLLLGGMLIGLLGILYDVAIGQAIAVEELRRASPTMNAKNLYLRAARIGKEHIGALVNTLAIAYAGASLPLLLLFYGQDAKISETLNTEVVATEVVRILVGSIGLVIAAPITTLISVAVLRNHTFSDAPGTHHAHPHADA